LVNDVNSVINKLHAYPALDVEEVIVLMLSSLHYFQQKPMIVASSEVDVLQWHFGVFNSAK
jgi:hypothetical protein